MAKQNTEEVNVTIKAPNLHVVEFDLVGTAPLVTARFAKKGEIMLKQQQGSTAKKGKAKEARDFTRDYEEAKHIDVRDGWCGVHAGAFRAALVSACRLVNFKMTLAKLSLFILADGFDQDGNPIVRINGTPEMVTHHTRNATGVVDIRARPMWREWSIRLRVRFDGDQFTATDVANLLMRVGAQVGIGEGRPDSKNSVGQGWGTFDIVTDAQEKTA